MWNSLVRWINAEHGSTSIEWAMVSTILILGAVTGALVSRPAVVTEPMLQEQSAVSVGKVRLER